MPRVMVLGAGGMLGHKMLQILSREFDDVWGVMRASKTCAHWKKVDLLQRPNVLDAFDASDPAKLQDLLVRLKPAVVVNCVGVIKQRAAAHSAIPSITLNALLPHRLAETLRDWDGRLVHISSDCVFSGKRGHYTEDDPSDAVDLYGRSKFLGEIAEGNVITLRTSIIGRELHHHESLLDWFLQQHGRRIRGFTRAWWSGVTTIHLSQLVSRLIRDHSTLHGLYQVSSGRMSKHDLLVLLRDAYKLDVEIVPDEEVFCDRSLDGTRLHRAIGYQAPSWHQLAAELVEDTTPYEMWSTLGAIR